MKETKCRGKIFRWGERTYVMGIINATPDSFSGDGIGGDADKALELARRFVEAGADIIDVGGESTRPGAAPVPVDEELRRVIPVIEKLASEIPVPISVDTYKSEVARRAVEAGACIINDVWGLKKDPKLADIAASTGSLLIITQNQRDSAFKDFWPELVQSLKKSIEFARSRGVPEGNIIIDPGIGFGKTVEQNLEILRRLSELKALGRPILIGPSRKSFIGAALDLPVDQRLEGTAAAVAIGIAHGADIIRVHDVPQMVRVARMCDAIVRGNF